jgi:hypothetical protein
MRDRSSSWKLVVATWIAALLAALAGRALAEESNVRTEASPTLRTSSARDIQINKSNANDHDH